MKEPIKVIVGDTGLDARVENPHTNGLGGIPFGRKNYEAWQKFDKANPSYPLTKQMEPGALIKGLLVWQRNYETEDGWMAVKNSVYGIYSSFEQYLDYAKSLGFLVRQAFEPIEQEVAKSDEGPLSASIETVEQACERIYPIDISQVFSQKTVDRNNGARAGFKKALEWQLSNSQQPVDNWIDAVRNPPKLIDGKDYSENVYAISNGQLDIMCYCYIPGDGGGFVWASCDGDINGDAEFDDDYEVTFWQPLPNKPQ